VVEKLLALSTIVEYKNKKNISKNLKRANTNTFILLFNNTNDNTGIGTLLEPIPPIPSFLSRGCREDFFLFLFLFIYNPI
jgi:hypothetical protein